MKIVWREISDGWVATDEDDPAPRSFLHLARRSNDNIRRSQPEERYCVFGHSMYDNYCGDLPLDMPEEQLKAVAITLWRVSQ